MKSINPRMFAVLGVVLALSCGVARAQDAAAASAGDEKAAREAAEGCLAAVQKQDIDKAMSFVAEDYMEAFTGSDKAALRGNLECAFREKKADDIVLQIAAVEPGAGFVAVHYVKTVKPAGKAQAGSVREVLFLQKRGTETRIVSSGSDAPEGAFDRATGRYTSAKGQYSIPIPAGWTAMGSPRELAGLVPDAAMAFAPDLKSFYLLGFVRLPIRMEPESAAKMALTADEAMAKRLLGNTYKAGGLEPLTANGMKGFSCTSEFTTESQSRKRLRAYFAKDSYIYFFICDAIPPDKFAALKPVFDSAIAGLTLVKPAEGASLNDQVSSGLASGTVAGSVYTNDEFNCHVAAPKGWELHTSPNPAHLCEMQYKAGKSIARLIGAKDIPSSATLQDVVEKRREAVRGLVKDFMETGRRTMTVGGVPAIESKQEYTVEGLGKIRVKEVTLINKGMYYLILCQVFEPDSFEKLEPDFDAIFRSFGFNK